MVKDLLTFSVGLGLIIRQGWFVPPSQFNLSLTLFAGALINVPGVSQLWALRTGGQRSEPPESESSPSLPSSPDTSSAADP